MKKLLLTLLLPVAFFATSKGQIIPNGGFEGGIEGTSTITGWETFNRVMVMDTQAFNLQGGGQLVVTASEGDKFIRLWTDSQTVNGQLVPILGIARTRFAYSGKPDSVKFSGMYLPANAEDRMLMVTLFTNWNTTTNQRDTIAVHSVQTNPGTNYISTTNGWLDIRASYSNLTIPSAYDSITMIFFSAGSQSNYGLNASLWLDNIRLYKTVVGVEETPIHFNTASSVYPNPFKGSTVISYNLEAAANVTLEVYDVQGRLISTLVNGMKPAGEHKANFDGAGLTPGVYMYKLQAGESVRTERMILAE